MIIISTRKVACDLVRIAGLCIPSLMDNLRLTFAAWGGGGGGERTVVNILTFCYYIGP